jgi:hypothetical protein
MVFAVFAGVYGWMEFNRGLSDAEDMPVKEQVSASDLMGAFQTDEALATTRFVGASEQVIQVRGVIRAVEPSGPGLTNVVLVTDDDMAGVVCEFREGEVPAEWRTGMEVAIKGICTGMLLDVILVRCVAVQR